MKLKNYIAGQWLEGTGEGIELRNAVNGELVATWRKEKNKLYVP